MLLDKNLSKNTLISIESSPAGLWNHIFIDPLENDPNRGSSQVVPIKDIGSLRLGTGEPLLRCR